MSLTLETLRAIRKRLGVEKQAMARLCSPVVLAWARAAGVSERALNELHAKLGTGWRMELPWLDTRADTPAPAHADEKDTYADSDGVRRWKYRAPYDHQKIMASAACSLDGCGFIADMGTGKTRAAFESIRHVLNTGEVEVVVVACPKGPMNVWEAQHKMWCGEHVNFVRLKGTVAKRIEEVRRRVAAGEERLVFLVNFDVMWKMREVFAEVGAQKRLGIVADEMHKLTNPEAQMTKAFMELARVARWRVGMTGTPMPNKVTGVWSEWYIIDLGITFGANFVQFRREFFNVNPYSWEMTPKDDGVYEEIGLRMRRRGLRFRKEDCLDLPPKIYEVEEVEMTNQQRAAYREMEETLVTQLENGEYATAAMQLTAILRLTQITSGFLPSESGAIQRFVPNPKLDALEELVRENIATQQVIVWARYREDIRAICYRLQDLRPVVVQGGQNDDDRLHAETSFQTSEHRLLVGNPQAGGVGLNLQMASLAIYYSQDYSLIARLQSEDRCHRSGSEIHEKITYIDLLCEGTVDEVVRRAVLEKKAIAEIVVDLRRSIGMVA